VKDRVCWGQRKAPSTPATMSTQHCRTLQVERFFRQSRTLLRHCCWCGRGLHDQSGNYMRSSFCGRKNIRDGNRTEPKPNQMLKCTFFLEYDMAYEQWTSDTLSK